MRSLLVCNIMSLDGYYEGPGGDVMALRMDTAFDAHNLERMRSADVLLLGRRSFEGFSSYWPDIADAPEDPGNSALDAVNREISREFRRLPKVVVSDSYRVPEGNPWRAGTAVVAGSALESRLAAARADGDGDILVLGSRTMWNGLLARGLVDELHLMVSANTVGSGTPLMDVAVDLELIEARCFPGSSNVVLRYRVIAA